MTRVLIRADASLAMGTGHVMRCLALATALREAGCACAFRSADTSPVIAARLALAGIEVTPVSEPAGSEVDAVATAALAAHQQADWVVLDGYHFSDAFEARLRAPGRGLLAIDDCGHAAHGAVDVLLNQNPHARSIRYAAGPRRLLGPRFALLRPEFRRARGEAPRSTDAKAIVVTMGGSDPNDATSAALVQLVALPDADLRFVVVIGKDNPRHDALRARFTDARLDWRHGVDDMSVAMRGCGMAVAAAGSTALELACLGLPSLLLGAADNQLGVAAGLAALGAAIDLGPLRALAPSRIRDEVAQLLADPARRSVLARAASEAVDGDGARRVAAVLTAPALALVPASMAEARTLWDLANDPVTRAASFDPRPIPWETHERWLAARLADPASLILLAKLDDGATVGVVRFELAEGTAVASVALAAAQRGRGLASAVIAAGCRRAWLRGDVARIVAYIRPGNQPSVAAFLGAGFAPGGTAVVKGAEALRFVLEGEG